MEQKENVRELTERLNRYRNAYYNTDAPLVSDEVYDRLFDKLVALEQETGIRMANSPTQTVGYPIVSGLPEAKHDIPLLSLKKTKSPDEMVAFMQGRLVNLSLKLDGLTTEIIYEGGKLQRLSTRGDGEVGEDITHNAAAITGIPMEIPYRERLVVVGESFIHKADFERLKDKLMDSTGKPYKHARNLAAGSVRAYKAATCAERCVHFLPFNVNEGFDEIPELRNSKRAKAVKLAEYGFGKVKTIQFSSADADMMQFHIEVLQKKAEEEDLPIDGMVITYDDIAYSKSCGRTGHHFRDGLAFKFEDEKYETVLRSIEWTPSRSGVIAPVAIFDTTEIDGTDVSRASLHNLSFIEELQAQPGCRILVSKRNMIIPHVEDNLDREGFNLDLVIPKECPCCGKPTRVQEKKDFSVTKGPTVIKTLHCDNPECPMRNLRKYVHFAGDKALDIEGMSEKKLKEFIAHGWLHTPTDIFHLDQHREEIIELPGFGEGSWRNLWEAIQKSLNTTFERFIISMDIPLVGNHASRILKKTFNGDLDAFRTAVADGYDFTQLPEFGETLHNNIHQWFNNEDNQKFWEEFKTMANIEKNENTAVSASAASNPFVGLTLVVTGKVDPYTRNGINAKIESLGAKAGSSVSKNTDYLICGENAGSKLAKARDLGVKVITPAEFFSMIGE